MTTRREHKLLYKKIPSFKCKDGCTDCCGPVPLSIYEASRLGIPGAFLTPTKAGDITCSFASDKGCSVYKKRPFMCRLFGAVDDPMLGCPHNKAPNKLMSSKEGVRLRSEYIKFFSKER